MRFFSCKSCEKRDGELALVREELVELKRENNRLERENQHLNEQNVTLKQENHQLREELARARRETNRQAAPFRREKLKKRKKKPGRRKGHPAANRPTPPPERIDRVVEVPCRACPDCATELVDPGTVIQYQTDLPPIVPIVIQFNIETGYCPCCRQRFGGISATWNEAPAQ